MALETLITGGVSSVLADVDANTNLKVNLPTTIAQTGYAGMAAVVHDGLAGLATKVVRSAEVSVNKRLRVGIDSLLFQDTFSYAAQFSAVWSNVLTTMTLTYVGGYAQLNAGASVASAAVARMVTYKYFPIINGAGLGIEFDAIFTQPLQTNNVMEMGLFQAATTAAPLDGVFFRFTAAGGFQGVVNYNGSETTVDLAATVGVPSTGLDHSYLLRIEQEQVAFYVDNVLGGIIVTPTGGNGPCMNMYQPICVRNYNNAVTSLAQVLKIGEVRLFCRDINTTKPWPQVMAGLGGMGCQGQQGQTQGSTALYTNSLAAGAGAAATNTTAALGSGLGGQFTLQPTLAAGTDGIISSYQVPLGTAANPGKTLVITGVWVDSKCMAALTGGPCYFAMSLGVGNNTVTLAQAEGAATKASRRIALGWQSFVVTAPVGQKSDEGRLFQTFTSPVTAAPGEFVQVVAKNLGTVTTVGAITFLIGFDTHWE